MSKNNTDVLLIGGLALAAVFMMGRARPATAAGSAGLARPVRTTGGLPWGFTGLPTGRVIGAITGGSNSPDLVAGATPGGSTGGFFSMIGAVDNANATVQSDYVSTLAGPDGLLPNDPRWLASVSTSPNVFTMPDMLNPMQTAYAGFDNPNNYG
ncbi:TPA: hypothetical protein QDB24_000454 [Burkholderia vietnamiensis]|uniref:hypothetical protein n=1 Tax=Burkholderia cepacia complex TaxID=87882 RepID=UPI00174E450A|nr:MULTISPECIES: hypothetical protein [Burkholderia cepacia complex]MBD1410246.1 hypothetical protein [Burkholderia contaminans]MBR7908574.1 hypothetical protein [Burkholderia vietnamiensis]UXZ70025.1 hypothetical protein NUJ29_31070 [Burkholderia contaminans]UXZ76732.1 hypothetical protein NUJ30_25470 [Burkholderia contaminans]HDR9272438.1 hypothetical protein [Burkholderia vietnamiensis]